jgi:hypothetical protein
VRDRWFCYLVPRQNDVGLPWWGSIPCNGRHAPRWTEAFGSARCRRLSVSGGWRPGGENGGGRGVRISGSAGRLCCSADVSMVEATDFAKRHDPAHLRSFDGPQVRRVLVERAMGSGAVIVREARGQNATQVPLAENGDIVEALSPHRADGPFHERILPRTVGRREDFIDPHALYSVPELLAVDLVAIAQEI